MMHRIPLVLWLFAFSLILRKQFGVLAVQVNVTIDDTDPSFVFSNVSTSAWFPSTSSGCSFCLAPSNPNVAFNRTWHHGLHVVPRFDSDDTPVDAATSQDTDGDAGPNGTDVDGDGDDKGSGGKGKGKRARTFTSRVARRRAGRRRDVTTIDTYYAETSTQAPAATETGNPFVTEKFDGDDPQFTDSPVFVQFNFTGNAVYVNCLLPLGVPPTTNNTPTLTNLTFTLDGQPVGAFLHNGTAAQSGFQPNATVFTQQNLALSQHTLRIDLGPDSVFLLDSVVYTQGEVSNSTGVNGSSSSSNTAPSSAPGVSKDSRNIATFGGVLGAIGVLATVGLCTAIRIIRRRRLSAKRIARERAERDSDAESFHTFDDGASVESDGPPMRGPAPFVPRFFPNTVPSNPPHYVPPEPVATEDSTDVPPPFAIAIASPEPPLLANIMRRPLDQLQPPPAFDALSTGESSDMEELGSSAPLILSANRRRSRPPSFRSTSSAPQSVPTLNASDAASSAGQGEASSLGQVERADAVPQAVVDETPHEDIR